MRDGEINKHFELNSSDIDPDWLRSWIKSVPDEALRVEIENNPRVNNKVVENVLLAHGLAPLIKDEIDEDVQNICNILKTNKDKFVDLCGLALMGSMLRKIVDPKILAKYIIVFNKELLQISMKAEIDYLEYSHLSIEKDQLAEFVKDAGMRCVAGWSWGLPASASLYVRLLLPKTYSSSAMKAKAIEHEKARETVYAIAKAFNRQEKRSDVDAAII